MPYMCNIQMPKGKPKEVIEKTMVEISEIMIRNFDAKPRQVRVIVDELPRNRYIVGGVMTTEMPEFEEAENICYYGIDLFQRDGDVWRRSFEEHAEYAYTTEELTQWLLEAGFDLVLPMGDCRLTPPRPEEQRIYFAAVKEEP